MQEVSLITVAKLGKVCQVRLKRRELLLKQADAFTKTPPH